MDPRALIRSVPYEMRAVSDGDGLTLSGYAAVFNSPTEIRGERHRDAPDGVFNEQLARGAFARGINAGKRPVLMFNHGKHPQIADIPIGKITEMREDARGLWVEARLGSDPMFSAVREAIAMETITGMSFRFSVPKGKETWTRDGDTPLRTISEVNCVELGPVVFPAYADTTVGIRSPLDDEEALELLRERLLLGTPAPGPATVTPDQQAREHSGSTPGERARVLRELTLKGLLQ